jgi:hypothetical protein
MPKPNYCYLKYEGWRFGQGNASVYSLAPPSINICICRGKMIRGIPIFFVEERFHLQYLTKKKKKTSKVDHYPPNMEVQNLKKNSPIIYTDVVSPSTIPSTKETR